MPVLKSELDMRNRSPGVLTSLVMCLNRQTLSSKNSQILSGLVNQALAIEHDQQALSHKVGSFDFFISKKWADD